MGEAPAILLIEDNPGDADLVRLRLVEGSGPVDVSCANRLSDGLASPGRLRIWPTLSTIYPLVFGQRIAVSSSFETPSSEFISGSIRRDVFVIMSRWLTRLSP